MSSKDHDQLFAQTVLEAFEAAELTTDLKVGVAGGPSTSWLTEARRVVKGRQPAFKGRPRPDTLDKIDKAAKWRPGSARKLLRNGTAPTPISGESPDWPAETVSDSTETSLSEWLTRMSDLTDEEREIVWDQAEPVLEALKASVLARRRRGSHLGDT